MKKIVLIILFLVNSSYADECKLSKPELKSILIPIDYDDKSLGQFYYNVGVIDKYPGAPYLIVIPGGPGETSIKRNLTLLPTGFNLVLIDPRTLGCNSNNPIETFKSVSTETLANDILTTIESLGIKNFIVYGESYGTQVATVLVAKLERKKLLPKSMVLEGTVGNERSSLPGYNSVLNKMLTRLPTPVVSSIRSIRPNGAKLLGFSSRTWAYFFLQMLSIGKSDPKNQPILEVLLSNGLDEPLNAQGVEVLKYLLYGVEKDIKNDSFTEEAFYLKINCSESYSFLPSDYDFEAGFLVYHANSLNKCSGFKLNNPYDPSSYNIRTPIWYFQGTEDPNTPLEGALYHFNSQKFSNRIFIKFIGAGHAATVASPQCSKQLWEFILKGERYKSLNNVCELPIEVIQRHSTEYPSLK